MIFRYCSVRLYHIYRIFEIAVGVSEKSADKYHSFGIACEGGNIFADGFIFVKSVRKGGFRPYHDFGAAVSGFLRQTCVCFADIFE